MEDFRKSYRESHMLHHATLLVGEKDTLVGELIDFLESDLSFPTRGNSDFYQWSGGSFGIDEARALKERVLMKSVGERKVALIVLDSITTEAQNSLLKLFEEPTGRTTLFIIAPTAEIFLKTLLSRLSVVEAGGKGSRETRKMAREFIKKRPKERLEDLSDMIERKDRAEAIDFLNALESEIALVMHKSLHEGASSGGGYLEKDSAEMFSARALQRIIRSKKYLHGRSPSLKMILEHLSCIIPRVE